jgi:mRNA-degrading endonuclease RelE of RelBE toxin-antitoxin system
MPYEIRYSTEAAEDIGALRAFDRSKIRASITEHLSHVPTRASRSRIKRMTQPFWCQFRLRVGDFRVYYDVEDQTENVIVLRVIRKGSGVTPGNSP